MEDSGLTRCGMSENTSTLDHSTPHVQEAIVTEPSTNPVHQSEMSSMRKLAVFSLTAFVYFLTWSCVGLWSPFFPGEATKRGVSSTEVGFIFGTYSLVAFLASLIYGPVLIPQIGPYSVLFAGLFVNGGANVISGFLNLITERKLFTIYCFIVRAVGALGGAACETAIIVIVTEEFRENLATVIGILEVFTGLGLVVGPVLGGVLYSLGGFRLPMVVTGGVLLVSLPLVWCLLPRKKYSKTADRRGHSFKKAIKIPGVLVMCMACFICLISLSFDNPILEPFAKTFGVNTVGVSLLFMCVSGSYMVASPIAGYMIKRKSCGRMLLVIGSLGVAISTLFFGPAPFLSSFVPEKKLWVLAVSLAVSGASSGIFFVPVLPEMLQCCHERGLPQSLTTNSLTSGLYSGFSNLGCFIGPVLGGISMDYVGFPWTSTIAAFLIGGQTVILSIFFMCNRRESSYTTLQH